MSTMASSHPPLGSSPVKQVVYSFNSKVMVAAMVILFIVVLFVVSLHIYAKWFWHRGTTATRWSATNVLNASWHHRRHGLVFVADESMNANTRTGLDPSTVSLLPTFAYEGAMLEAEPLLECAVCLSEFQVHEKGRILPSCKHTFHIDCIDMWLHLHSTCPLCRHPILLPVAHEGSSNNHGSTFVQLNLSPGSHQQHADELNTFASESADSQEPPSFLVDMPGLQLHPPASVSHTQIPSYVEFFCKHDMAHANLPRMGASGSTSARALPTGIVRQQGRAEFARSTSLSLSRVLSEDEQTRLSQPQKSSSFRISLKRLMSRELSKGRSRVFPAGQVHVETEQSATAMQPPV